MMPEQAVKSPEPRREFRPAGVTGGGGVAAALARSLKPKATVRRSASAGSAATTSGVRAARPPRRTDWLPPGTPSGRSSPSRRRTADERRRAASGLRTSRKTDCSRGETASSGRNAGSDGDNRLDRALGVRLVTDGQEAEGAVLLDETRHGRVADARSTSADRASSAPRRTTRRHTVAWRRPASPGRRPRRPAGEGRPPPPG